MSLCENSFRSGFTFVSAVIIVAVLSLSIWAGLILTDIILKSSMIEDTREEMETISEGLREFYRDCDQFVKDTNDVTVDFADLEIRPSTTRFEGSASLQSYRRSQWNGPYIQDKYDDNGYTRDAWNTAYRYNYTAGSTSCTLRSCGPDRTCGNSDDITITVSAEEIYQEKIRKVKEELAYINAKKEELESRYTNAGRTWPPAGFGIEDLFDTYGCDTTGLVAWWKMDEARWDGTSGEVVDSAGSNDGTAYGGATTVSGGKIGRCGNFDGSSHQYVLSTTSLSIFSEYTLEQWTKGELDNQISQNIYGVGWNGKIALRHASGGTNPLTGILIRNAADSGYYSVQTSTDHLDGEWHFLVATVNRNVSPIQVRVYLDGKLETSGTISDHYSGSLPVVIAAWSTGYGYFTGYVDEVRIWNRALTSDDVFLEYLRGTYLVDWAYRYDEWQMEYQWDSTNDEFYSCGRDRVAGTSDDIYQTE